MIAPMRCPPISTLLLASWAAVSPAAELPQYSTEPHLGVGECAGGPCHGSAAPAGGRVSQNEHTIWLRAEKHSAAYLSLLGERPRAIARSLGLGAPEEARECLDCHADNAAARGERHQLEDGVGCEACHGAASSWLKTHASSNRTHARNLEQGMYPTDEPLARAELCVSCHFGSARKFVSHRMLGAGHPRLRFELDSFALDQPPHYRVDSDYRLRGKRAPDSVKIWAIGQAVLVREFLAVLADPQRSRDGIWPDFAVLDCYACHHRMETRRRKPRASTGLGRHPGLPRQQFAELDGGQAGEQRQPTANAVDHRTHELRITRFVGHPDHLARNRAQEPREQRLVGVNDVVSEDVLAS